MQLTGLVLALAAVALVTGWLAVYAFARRTTPAALAFGLLLSCMALYAAGYALELATSELHWMKRFNTLQYCSIVSLPVLWLNFILHHTGRAEWLTLRRLVGLCLVPAAILVLNATNDYHHWYYARVWVAEVGASTTLGLQPGPLFLIQPIYSYVLVLTGLILLVRTWLQASAVSWLRMTSIYRRQTALILAATFVPVAVNLAYLGFRQPLHQLDITPFAFGLSSVLAAYGLFHYNLIDARPVVRSALVDILGDGVLVIDLQGRIIDGNLAAAAFLGLELDKVLGQRAAVALQALPELWEMCATSAGPGLELELPGDRLSWVEARCTALNDRQGRAMGHALLLHDITHRKAVEQELSAQRLEERETESIRATVATLAHEINNPLTGIMGYLSLLIEFAQEEGDRQMLSECMTAAKRIRDTVSRLEGLRVPQYRRYHARQEILNLPGLADEGADSAAEADQPGI